MPQLVATDAFAIGVDLSFVPWIEHSEAEFGHRFLERLYSEAELTYCDRMAGTRRAQSLAARLAAKEATIKALDASGLGLGLRDIETERSPSGAVRLRLTGAAASRAAEKGLRAWFVSLTHEGPFAIAFVVGASHALPPAMRHSIQRASSQLCAQLGCGNNPGTTPGLQEP